MRKLIDLTGKRFGWHLGLQKENPDAFHILYGTHNCTELDFYEWLGSL